MRVTTARFLIGVLAVLFWLACSNGVKYPATAGLKLEAGNCSGCLLAPHEDMFSFVARDEADYETLVRSCFPQNMRNQWLPPRPGTGELLVYVSIEGSGCRGCLDVVNVRETPRSIVVEVEGGIQGACEMLVVPGAWALIPKTKEKITFLFREVDCPDDL